jgi:hypothetical protein
VNDIVLELNGTGVGPYSLFNVNGITSGQIYDKITEANGALQGWVGSSIVTQATTDALAKEQVKRFEVNYASARLAADLIGVMITDGFNVALAGTSIQRVTAQTQGYLNFIKEHMDTSKWYIKMLHQWYFVFNPDYPTGFTEWGNPTQYWKTSDVSY